MGSVRLGAAQKRALVQMAIDAQGTAEVTAASAAGLILNGLAMGVRRSRHGVYAPFICRITDYGRAYVAQITG